MGVFHKISRSDGLVKEGLMMSWWLEEVDDYREINQELEHLTQFETCPYPSIQVQSDGAGKLVKLMESDDCLGFALIASNREFPYQSIFSRLLTTQFESNEDLDGDYLPRFEQGCTIIWLSSLVRGLGVGHELVEAIKQHYNSVLLYSVEESMGFWEKQEFQSFQESPLYGFEWNPL